MPDKTLTEVDSAAILMAMTDPRVCGADVVITLSLVDVWNRGACDRKIEKMLRDAGVSARLTGVCSGLEIRPRSSDTTSPEEWAIWVAISIIKEWHNLQR